MSPGVWDEYPPGYRAREVEAAQTAAKAGECFALIGLSGSGKSNVLGFLAQRAQGGPHFVLADCNRLEETRAVALFGLLDEALGGAGGEKRTLRELERQVEAGLGEHPQGICLLLDRFERIDASGDAAISGGLRALRDRFKYRLTYGIAMRRALDPFNELAELFFGHTIWLGGLAHEDALWSAGQYGVRRGKAWDARTLERMVTLSKGYPSLLRGVCEAHAGGCALEVDALKAHPAVARRAAEFWADSPSLADLRASGLEGHPLLESGAGAAMPSDAAGLTAAEERLLGALRSRAGQVCAKDELIAAVWPEEMVAGGLRDDSLAQLVHRLREKIEAEPAHPRLIQTAPGRGYKFQG